MKKKRKKRPTPSAPNSVGKIGFHNAGHLYKTCITGLFSRLYSSQFIIKSDWTSKCSWLTWLGSKLDYRLHGDWIMFAQLSVVIPNDY